MNDIPWQFLLILCTVVLFIVAQIFFFSKSFSVFFNIFKLFKSGQLKPYSKTNQPFSPPSLCSWKEYEETIDGLKIRYRWSGGDDRRQAYFLWKIPTHADEEFLIKVNHSDLGILKKIGISKPFELGDADFDQKFRIDTRDPEFVFSYFLSSERKEAVKKLFSMGFYDLNVKKDSLEIKIYPQFGYGYDPNIPPEVIAQNLKVAAEYFKNPANMFKVLSEGMSQLQPATPEEMKGLLGQREQFLKDAVKEIRILIS